MKDFLAIILFLCFVFTLIYVDSHREDVLYECQKSQDSSPYFIGLESDFLRLQEKLSSYKQEDCHKKPIMRQDWYSIKNQIKYRKY